MARPVGLTDVRQAIHDQRFRELFPELKQEFATTEGKKCGACFVQLAERILNEYADRLKTYFPGREVVSLAKEAAALAKNHWRVINCTVHDLEKRLRELPPGRKQISLARYQDQITMVINDLEFIV